MRLRADLEEGSGALDVAPRLLGRRFVPSQIPGQHHELPRRHEPGTEERGQGIGAEPPAAEGRGRLLRDEARLDDCPEQDFASPTGGSGIARASSLLSRGARV
ncbi:MAG: hypothetical protein HY720_16900 [Planctomycetes bacterium]|nr:hypothetical protein [Planctomycetota bacterium]